MAIAAARQSSQDGYHVVSRAQLFDRIAVAPPGRIAVRLSRRHRSGRFCDGFFAAVARQSGLEPNRAGPMSKAFLSHIDSELQGLKSAGLYKSERVISSM
ncbi:MAG: hypothetical protein E5V99_14810, partial [Mesorhizobium sp.]